MGLRINTNVQSMKAQNVLESTTRKLNTALERLSTGLRINTGKDDSVGLSKSESLRAQIRGIDVAKRNIANASSVLGTSEGVLAQLTDIGQQMREVAVQAADGTLSASDRSALTTKFTDLMSEYNRLANNAEFSGVKLVDGTFSNKSIQVGPDSTSGNAISVSISDARSSTIGQVAVLTSLGRSNFAQSFNGSDINFSDPAGIAINGVALGSLSADGVSSADADPDESAISYVNAINAISGSTGVTATVRGTSITLTYGNASTSIGAAQTFSINGVSIKTASDASVGAGCDTEAQVMVNLINAKSASTGVVAALDTTSDTIKLAAPDGRNISMSTGAAISGINALGYLGAGAGTISTQGLVAYRGSFIMQSDSTFTVTGANAEFLTNNNTTAVVDSTMALANASVGDSTSANNAINTLDNVITQLQTRRGVIGSTSNRLDIADAELSSRQENLSAAESRIRDADIAVETARLTQQQILQQAGVTVLGAANSAPQIALTLLQNLG